MCCKYLMCQHLYLTLSFKKWIREKCHVFLNLKLLLLWSWAKMYSNQQLMLYIYRKSKSLILSWELNLYTHVLFTFFKYLDNMQLDHVCSESNDCFKKVSMIQRGELLQGVKIYNSFKLFKKAVMYNVLWNYEICVSSYWLE